jgi:hypothetical protein
VFRIAPVLGRSQKFSLRRELCWPRAHRSGMSNMPLHQLPSPYVVSAAPAPHQYAPQPQAPFLTAQPAPTPGRKGAPVLGAIIGLAVAGASLFGWLRSDDDKSATPTSVVTNPTDGTVGNNTITRDQLAQAYSVTFGVTASAPSLDCVEQQIASGGGGQAERLVRGEALTLEQAQQAFTPFVACAPDTDFLTLMVPATVEAFGGQIDEACVTGVFQSFGVAGRAHARALAWTDTAEFVRQLQLTFQDCSF